MQKFNEYSRLLRVAVRNPNSAFVSQKKLQNEWEKLRFADVPNFEKACHEFEIFKNIIEKTGAKIIELPAHRDLTIDSIYPRDSNLICPEGIIKCNMGRATRTVEAKVNGDLYKMLDLPSAGEVKKPGTLEGGDFIWIDEHHAAVGLGPRTNKSGVAQLKNILGSDVDLMIVDLPEPDHPDDVLHLMSIISPIDCDLAVVYEKFAPDTFIDWLKNLNIEIISISDDEYENMGCNVLALAPREVLILDGCESVREKLIAKDCIVHTYTGNEISRKGEGGPTCLTRPLLRG